MSLSPEEIAKRVRQKDKHRVMLEICDRVATLSTCARRSVGAVIVDAQGHVLSVGYNGVARGQAHCTVTSCRGAGETPGVTSLCEAIHAEQNAIVHCAAIRFADTLYVTCSPCNACAKLILSTPIKRVIVRELYADASGYNLLLDAGVGLYKFVDGCTTCGARVVDHKCVSCRSYSAVYEDGLQLQ